MKKVSSLILLTLNLFLVYWIFNSVKSEVDQQAAIRDRQKWIVDKLEFIRELQIIHKNQKGSYAKSWKDLIRFGNDDSVYLVVNRKIPVPEHAGLSSNKEYVMDTIRRTSVYDSLVSKSPYSIATLQDIPGYTDEHFVLSTDVILIGGISAEVIEVSCPSSIDLSLKFGSKENITLAGNWR